METKTCSGPCGKEKPVGDFAWRNKKLGKRHSKCKICWNEFNRSRYRENPKYYVDKAMKRNKIVRAELYQKVYDYLLEHTCIDCPETDPVVLTFDHVRGDKKLEISRMISQGFSWQTISEEIEKCVVRCFNCHMKKTAKERNWATYQIGVLSETRPRSSIG